jgi:hypothetical protein
MHVHVHVHVGSTLGKGDGTPDKSDFLVVLYKF